MFSHLDLHLPNYRQLRRLSNWLQVPKYHAITVLEGGPVLKEDELCYNGIRENNYNNILDIKGITSDQISISLVKHHQFPVL